MIIVVLMLVRLSWLKLCRNIVVNVSIVNCGVYSRLMLSMMCYMGLFVSGLCVWLVVGGCWVMWCVVMGVVVGLVGGLCS